MAIALAILSIFVFAAAAAAINKIFALKICPICAGVAGTWLLMLFLRFLEYPVSVPLLTMLLGGSVVGIAYTLAKRLPPPHSAPLFKAFFIPVGFVAAYGIVIEDWIMSAGGIIALVIIVGIFLSSGKMQRGDTSLPARRSLGAGGREESPQRNPDENLDELKKKLDECC